MAVSHTRYRGVTRCGVDAAARDDLFQDIILKVHGAAATYRPDRPLMPWLFTIVANTVRSHYRKLRVQMLVFPDQTPDVDPAPTSQATLEARETHAYLEDAITELKLSEREVVILVCIEGMDLKQVAQVLDMPLGTVKTHLHRARVSLARALTRRNAKLAREAGQ